MLLSGVCVPLAWRGASALNIAQIGTPLRLFRVGPPQSLSLSESTQFGLITPNVGPPQSLSESTQFGPITPN